MISKLGRVQLLVFVLVAVVAVTYAAAEYVNLPRLLGLGRYSVAIEMSKADGLYPNGVVTLRGLTVGQVKDVELTPTGVVADVQIDDGTQIPAASAVQLRSTSAVGEQYLNFEPAGPAGPYLGDGSRVPASQVALPVDTAALLAKANSLAASVPSAQLTTTINEAATAFGNSGEHLQSLVGSAVAFQRDADANLGPTVGLFRNLVPVLGTQQRDIPQIGGFTRDLASFTHQLATSDQDLRSTLNVTPPFIGEVNSLINGVRPTVPLLLANLTSTGQVTRVYVPSLAATVVIFEQAGNLVTGATSATPLFGTAKIDFRAQVNNPAPCTLGYQQNRRAPQDLSPAVPGTDNHCKEPPNSDKAVRGARNNPCPALSPRPDGRSDTAAGCGLNFQTPAEAAQATASAIQTELEGAANNAKTPQLSSPKPLDSPNYTPTDNNGNAVGYRGGPNGESTLPGGESFVLGSPTPGPSKGFKGLLLTPLGLGSSEATGAPR